MPASDHGNDIDESLVASPRGALDGFKQNGHATVKRHDLTHGASTSKTTISRADEVDDLMSAVQSLIVPYIRDADEAAEAKITGNLPLDASGKPQSALVERLEPKELVERMNFSVPDGEGLGKEGLLETIKQVLQYSVNTWDQGWMDKLTASTNPVGIISEVILGVLNTNVHVYHVSPALTVIEKITARALAAQFGFVGPHAGGVTCQGGSASNLTSLIIARNVLYPETKLTGSQPHNFVIFTSAHGHFSVEKAAVTAGMGASAVIPVPVDETGRMDAKELRQLIKEAKSHGRTPLYVNATAGTTVMGVFDPIKEIKEICDEFCMWLHVDGSWGGSIAFSEKHKHKLEGCELADSLTINPQKILNVPMTCSFLLTNDLGKFHEANSLRAGYLFHEPEDDEVWDLADLTLQCGRRADSLKLALSWIYYGSSGFERGIDHAFDMATLLATLVQESPDFELVSETPSSCLQVCFYYTPSGQIGETNEENTRRTKEMTKKMVGRGFMFDYAPGPKGHFFRMVTNCQTLPGTMEGLFKGLQEVGKEVVLS